MFRTESHFQSLFFILLEISCITLLFLINGGVFADEVIIGDTRESVSYVPNRLNREFSYSQQIYLQSEINTGKAINITSLSFYFDGADNKITRTIVVYLSHTSKKSFSDSTDWVTSGLKKVYSGDYALTTAKGWCEIVLDNPFLYNNSDNLLISFDDNTDLALAVTNDRFNGTIYSSNRSIYHNSASSNEDPFNPPNKASGLAAYCVAVKIRYSSDEGSTSYTWDPSSTAGIQGGAGTWGADKFWTNDGGSTHGAWPGNGNDATFAGADGTYAITVNGIQNVDSLTFNNSRYTLSSGTINFGSNNHISIASGKTATISSIINGTSGLTIGLRGTLTLGGANTYTGPTVINGGGTSAFLTVTNLGNGGTPSSLGKSSNAASNLVFNPCNFEYLGGAQSCDRLFTMGPGNSCIYNSGSGALTMTNTGAIEYTGSGKRNFFLGYSNTGGANTFAPILADGPGGSTDLSVAGSGSSWILTGINTYTGPTTILATNTLQIGNSGTTGAISNSSNIANSGILIFDRSNAYSYSGIIYGSGNVIKKGNGTLTLGGTNTYTGVTTISSGVLHVTGSFASGSAVTLAQGATLGGTGTINGTVVANGIIAPGTTEYGKLTIGNDLTFTKSGNLSVAIGGTTAGTTYDQVVMSSGTLALASATLSLTLSYVPKTSETYTIIDNAGTRSVNGIFKDFPPGTIIALNYKEKSYDFIISYSGGTNNNDVTLTCTGLTTVAINAVKLSSLTFDSTMGAIRVGWNIDTAQYNGTLDIGISCNINQYPTTMNNGITITSPPVNGDTLLFPKPLLPDTLYYVVLFVRKPGREWVEATDSPRGTIRTGASVIAEAVKITTLTFDSVAAAIRIGWSIDTEKFNGQLDIGIAYNIDSYPVDMSDGTVVTTPQVNGEILLQSNTLLPDTLYYIALFVRKAGGKWVGANSSLRGTVWTGLSIISEATTLTTLRFDSITSAIRVGWNIDTTKYRGQFDIGIAYHLNQYPGTMNNGIIISTPSIHDSTLLQPKPLLPDTLYYVSLFIRKPYGEWVGDTKKLRGTVRSGGSVIADATTITTLTFDSISTAIEIGWKINTSKYNGPFDIGIAYDFEQYPDTMNNGIIISAPSANGSTKLQPKPLLPDTLYYVSLFVRKPGGKWIGATDSLRGTVRTGVTVLSGVTKITSLKLDPLAVAISIGWNIDTSKYNYILDIGIAYSLVQYPVDMEKGTIISAPSVNGTTLLEPRPLLPDTLYYVSLFIRKPGGGWFGGTNSMHSAVYTGILSREIVNFADISVGDTIQVFDNQVILWKDSVSNGSVDTLEVYHYVVPQGFMVIGTSFKFVNPHPTSSVFIGIRINALPSDVSIYDVRIYNDSAGVIKVNYLSQVDSINRIVYVKATNTRLPFIAMVDWTKPTVASVSNDSSPVYPNRDLIDSVSINDNVFNVRWEHLYNRADSILKVQKSGILSGTNSILKLVIPASSGVINSECGIRSLLVISDGTHSDTINLSRSVYRDKSDLFTTQKETWKPVFSTAILDASNPDSLLVVRSAGEKSVYDQRYRRLFRWGKIDNSLNNASAGWNEFDPADEISKSYFSIVPGRLFWLKTRDKNTINLGPGYTVSLRKPFTFTLPPKQFIDFGTPFRFDVQIDDILSASGSVADSLQIYEWLYNETSQRYTCEPLYIKDMVGKQDKSQLVTFKKTGAYCLYNPNKQSIDLKIPPILGTKSVVKNLAKKKSNPDYWGAKLITSNLKGYALPALYCGYAPVLGKGDYPVVPSFEDVRVFLNDSSFSNPQGHYIAEEAANGFAREIHISNSSESTEIISYQFETVGAFPESFSPYLFDNTTESYSTNGTFSIKPHSTISRWIIVGDSNWRGKFTNSMSTIKYSMKPIYPNPARSIVNIRYSVGISAVQRMRITIFDLHGRIVWEKHIDTKLSPGNHMVTWDGTSRTHKTISAGMYLIRMSVVDSKGEITQQFDKRFTFIP